MTSLFTANQFHTVPINCTLTNYRERASDAIQPKFPPNGFPINLPASAYVGTSGGPAGPPSPQNNSLANNPHPPQPTTHLTLPRLLPLKWLCAALSLSLPSWKVLSTSCGAAKHSKRTFRVRSFCSAYLH